MDLLVADHVDQVRHLLGMKLGDLRRALGNAHVGHLAGEHHQIAGRRDADLLVREQLAELGLQSIQVARDLQRQHQRLVVFIPQRQIRRAHPARGQEEL